MIKLIIFDMSGVLSNEEESPFVYSFAKKRSLDPDTFYEEYTALIQRAEIGEFEGTEVWKRLLKQYHIEEDIPTIINSLVQNKEFYQDMLNCVQELRKKYHTCFFTNYNQTYWELIEKKFDLSPYFEYGLVAYQIQSRKPARKGFEHLLERFGVSADEAVFTDDSEKNLSNAKEMGIHTIQFQNKEQFLSDLENIEKR